MSEKRFEFKLKVNFIDEETGEEIYHKMLIDNSNGNEIGFDDMVGLLNEQQATIDKLDQENAKLLSERIKDCEEFEECVNKAQSLKKENERLKDYIDTIFEDNTHICKELDIEDVQFYCERNKDYRSPSCLYQKCFNEENLVELSEKIKELFDDE